MKLRRTQSNLEDDIDVDDDECEDDGTRDGEQESDTESGGSIKIPAVVKQKVTPHTNETAGRKRAPSSEVTEVEIETLKTLSKVILEWDDGNGKESRDHDDLFGMLVADELKSLNQPRNQAPIEALD